MKISFSTKLSFEECLRRIKSNPKNVERSKRYMTLFDADKELFYQINNDQIRLEKAIISRNIFKPVFYGKFLKSSKSTLLEGTFERNPFAKTFFIIWFGFIAITGVGGQIVFLVSPEAEGSPIGLFLVTLLFTCIGIIFLKLMTAQAKDYERQTIQFIENTIVAIRYGVENR